MGTYSIYKPTDGGYSGLPLLLYDCADDTSAIQEAVRLVKFTQVELWEGMRKVATLKPQGKRPQLRVINGGKSFSSQLPKEVAPAARLGPRQ
jgi:hypothetical protein